MMTPVATVKCMCVVVQVELGLYDEDGNLVGQAAFPQVDGNVGFAKLFHPHGEQLERLIATCTEQVWKQLHAQGERSPEVRNGFEENGRGQRAGEPEARTTARGE